MKRIAAVQSNYIPWIGYFSLLASVDEFILYDDVQFTKDDWRNRNKIKTPQGVNWLSIPVGSNVSRLIREVEINLPWRERHWKTLQRSYSKSPFFKEVSFFLEPIYIEGSETSLSAVNRAFIEAICEYLQVETNLSSSMDLDLNGDRNERLVGFCLQTGADEYVSGPAAKAYLDENLFRQHGIEVSWFDYGAPGSYPQLWGDFIPGLSIVDALFNLGPKTRNLVDVRR